MSCVYNTGLFTKKVFIESNKLINEFGSELNVLLEAPEEKLKLLTDKKIVDVLMKNRQGKIKVQPGYDGVYGKLLLDGKIENKSKQKNLKSFT